MKPLTTMLALGLLLTGSAHAAENLQAMPADLETRFALSAVPPALRKHATVYLLDPAQGYHVSRQGTSGVACLVERTQWEHGEFRDDLYVPLCYDAAGDASYLQMIRDTAALRAQGWNAAAVKAEILARWANRTYRVPAKPGLSYMVAPVMRTSGPPDMKVHTMAMPHLMFYAPFATNADIDAKPDFTDPGSLMNPFVDVQGLPEHSYFIQLIGATERAQILRDERPLIDALCAYRQILCLSSHSH
jgi:hypothetical protein